MTGGKLERKSRRRLCTPTRARWPTPPVASAQSAKHQRFLEAGRKDLECCRLKVTALPRVPPGCSSYFQSPKTSTFSNTGDQPAVHGLLRAHAPQMKACGSAPACWSSDTSGPMSLGWGQQPAEKRGPRGHLATGTPEETVPRNQEERFPIPSANRDVPLGRQLPGTRAQPLSKPALSRPVLNVHVPPNV